MKYEKLGKNALKCMYVGSGIWDIILMVAVVVAWRMFFPDYFIAKVIAILLLAGLVFELLVNPVIRYHRYRYAIDEECIDIYEGYIFVERNIVPMERLHKIAVNRGPIDRMFGLGKVVVTTAGGDVVIRYLDMEKVEQIVELLKHRINEIARQGKGGEDGK